MIDAIIDDSYIIAGKLNRGLIISKELSKWLMKLLYYSYR